MKDKIFFPFLKQINHSVPKGKSVEILDLDNVSSFITNNNYSGGVFEGHQRSLRNWKKTKVIILDIDEQQNRNMRQVHESLKQFNHLIAPTENNMISKNGEKPCERYRLLIFLDDYLYSSSIYKEIVRNLSRRLEINNDIRAEDASHYFKKSKHTEYLVDDADFFKIRDLVDEVIYKANKIDNDWWEGYKLSLNDIPLKLKEIISKQRNSESRGKFEEFVRMLMAQHNLVWIVKETREPIGEGKIPINQVFFASQLRIDVRVFRKWLNILIDEKQLRIYSSDYGKGWTSRLYTAINDLREGVIESYRSINKINPKYTLPDHIDDGDWDRELFNAAHYFKTDTTPERFFKWARSLPNFNDKSDREHHLQHKWNSVKKYLEYINT